MLTVTVDGELPEDGVAAAARLMDTVVADGRVVRMSKRRPPIAQSDPRAVREQLAAMLPESTLEELRRNNDDLIAALEDLKGQKEQLLLLNAELQETNRGVMALYSELSEELEQTNRGVVALYRELDEKSEQLRAASESKDRFWANVSHELRTPLNSITGLTRLLADPAGGLDAEQLYQVELIRNTTGTLLTLVNDLLDVAKAESGQLVIDPAEVNLPALLATLRGLTRPIAEGKPVDVVVSADGAPATVLTDEIALTAILRNLLSNAIKYTDQGEVRLTVRTAGGGIEIRVSDTGTGIPVDQLERVFEEFYQVPGVRRGGTGLGLPYARRLAGLLGGELDADQQGRRGDDRRAAPAARDAVRRHGRGGRRRRGLPPGAEVDAGRHRRPAHRGRGRRAGARRRRRRRRRPGAHRPDHARRGRRARCSSGCRPACPRSSSPASTWRPRRAPRRCCARTELTRERLAFAIRGVSEAAR